MITLHQYPPGFGLASLSPFCLKVEYFLRLANLPYTVMTELNPARGPKGKMPFLEDGEHVIADSSFILDHLIEKYQLHHLRVSDPIATGMKAMIEEGLYFVLLYSRWVDRTGFQVVLRDFSPLFPPLIGRPVLHLIRRNLKKQAMAQGIGRHSRNEVYAIGCQYINALAAQLGSRSVFFGDQLNEFDVICFSFLQTILEQDIDSPLKECIYEHQNLIKYIERLKAKLEP